MNYFKTCTAWTKVWAAAAFLASHLLLCMPSHTFALQDSHKQRVLVLHSYHHGYKWTDDENTGIETVLKDVIGASNHRDRLFPGTPVVFCGVNYFRKEDLSVTV